MRILQLDQGLTYVSALYYINNSGISSLCLTPRCMWIKTGNNEWSNEHRKIPTTRLAFMISDTGAMVYQRWE